MYSEELKIVKYINTADEWFKLLKMHKDGKINLTMETMLEDGGLIVEYIILDPFYFDYESEWWNT